MTQDQARLLRLRNQGLLRPFPDPYTALQALVAVQTQYAQSLHVALLARSEAFPKSWELDELTPAGRIVKAWSVRLTLHAHALEPHAMLTRALGPVWYGRYAAWFQKHSFDLPRLESAIVEALASGPLNRAELHAQVPALRAIPSTGWGVDVMGLAYQGRLRVVGRGASQRFSLHDLPEIPARVGDVLLAYLHAYGPATPRDFAYWSGLRAPQIRQAFAETAGLLREVSIEGLPDAYFALDRSEIPNEEPPIRLLAKFDPLTMGHREKSLHIAPEHRSAIFRPAGQVEAVVLIGGMAAGTWRMRAGKRPDFQWTPLRAWTAREARAVKREFEKLE